MTSNPDALVVGAGSAVGGRLVRSLLLQGLQVRAVDRRPCPAWTEVHDAADNRTVDLGDPADAVTALAGAVTVYDVTALAPVPAHVDRMTAVLVDTNVLLAARETGADRVLVASSLVTGAGVTVGVTEDDRLWRRRFTERMAHHLFDDCDLQTRVARLGPVYGDLADQHTVVGVVTRRVAAALAAGRRTVEIPYAADASCSQVYVDDAVLGLQLIAHGTDTCGPHVVVDPAPVSVADVVAAVVTAAEATLEVTYSAVLTTPDVVGDAATLRATVEWTPDIPLSATAQRVWSATAPDVRRQLDLPPSVQERRDRRRAAFAVGHVGSPGLSFHRQVAGRHRYENAG